MDLFGNKIKKQYNELKQTHVQDLQNLSNKYLTDIKLLTEKYNFQINEFQLQQDKFQQNINILSSQLTTNNEIMTKLIDIFNNNFNDKNLDIKQQLTHISAVITNINNILHELLSDNELIKNNLNNNIIISNNSETLDFKNELIDLHNKIINLTKENISLQNVQSYYQNKYNNPYKFLIFSLGLNNLEELDINNLIDLRFSDLSNMSKKNKELTINVSDEFKKSIETLRTDNILNKHPDQFNTNFYNCLITYDCPNIANDEIITNINNYIIKKGEKILNQLIKDKEISKEFLQLTNVKEIENE